MRFRLARERTARSGWRGAMSPEAYCTALGVPGFSASATGLRCYVGINISAKRASGSAGVRVDEAVAPERADAEDDYRETDDAPRACAEEAQSVGEPA